MHIATKSYERIDKMRVGVISTRLNGTDGVSLEVEKWATVLKRMGHEMYYCAGELGGYAAGGTLIPQLHFDHQSIDAIVLLMPLTYPGLIKILDVLNG